MTAPLPPADDLAVRRKRAARMALVIGAIALAIYIAFIASGVVAK
ncbi:hypothetical protein [Pseudoxanthomonas gei]|nr:hypothetical protein [Pseudoxanthomonas gei]